MKSEFKIISCIVLMLLPLSIRGQHTGLWGDGKLRQAAIELSSDVPFAIIAYDFAERYLTELQQLPPNEQISRMERDDVTIVQGDMTRVPLIYEKTSLMLAEKDDFYSIGFVNDDFPLIELKFPASCQLLLGKNLKTLEEEWVKDLDTFSDFSTVDTDVEEELKPLSGNFFVCEGETYYMEGIHNHQYFEKKDGHLKRIFTMDHPVESVSSLFQSGTAVAKVSLCLTVRKYGLKKEQKEVPINKWVAYQRNKGCNIYVGIEEMKNDRIRAMVFVVNAVLRYNHVMNVEIPYDLFVKGEGCIEGDINLFIPTHNIKSLFDELNAQDRISKRQIKIK